MFKVSPDSKVSEAVSNGFNVFVPKSKQGDFDNYKITGTIESALDNSDLVIDASPGGVGYKNKTELYVPKNLMAIYQGGESITGNTAVSDLLFNSRVNYSDAFEKNHVMQGSCNVTGMGRILEPLRQKYGQDIKRFDVTLVRRWADIDQTDKKIIDTIEMTEHPHHGDDVKSYFGKDSPLFVLSLIHI